jgi:hypothetical protein
MPFYLQKVSDFGTSHPLVARTSFQANKLMESFPLENKRKEEIFGILHFKVLPHLLSCWKIVESITSTITLQGTPVTFAYVFQFYTYCM